jgi:hypothetical protein
MANPTSRTPVLVMFGRFQPPTIAHYALFERAKKATRGPKGKELNLDVTPVVAVIHGEKSGQDKNRNPLSPEDRIKFMQASGKADGINFVHANDVMAALNKLREQGKEPLVVMTGSDRGRTYVDLMNKYLKTDDEQPIKHYMINVGRDEDSDDSGGSDEILNNMTDEIPLELVSGTLARTAARKDMHDKFKVITGLPDNVAKIMAKKIKDAK